MITIRAKLYKTPWKLRWKYLFNWLISIRTLSKYSHIGLWFADDKGFFRSPWVQVADKRIKYYGTCYTSTMRGEANGTVRRPASEVLTHPENWDIIEFEVTDEQYTSLRMILDIEVDKNKGYSKWDILKFIFPIHFPDNKRWICSELVNEMLVYIGVLSGDGIVSPQGVVKKFKKLGLVPKSLV